MYRIKMRHYLSLILLLYMSLFSCALAQEDEDISKSVPVKNMHKVDKGIYRSAQPSPKEFIELEKAGITEVLNLRRLHSDDEKAENTNLMLHWVRSNAELLREKHLLEALKIIKNRQGNILVHCKHGSDRTGAVIAMYRIVFQNWTKDQAIEEMKNGGYGFHKIYFNIPFLIKRIDIEKFKKKLFEND